MSILPWEQTPVGTRPWEGVDEYPRTIVFRRPSQPVQAGPGAYSGLLPANETLIIANIPANIQIDRTGRPSEARLPADAIGNPTHKFFVPTALLYVGQIKERDVIVDEVGSRYQIVAIEWQTLGVQIRAQLLEA